MQRLMPALACVALLAAGCIGAAQATAMDARGPADAAARLWAPDALLAQALAVEGTGDLARRAAQWLTGAPAAEPGDDDERVGDGRAAAWVYRFVSDERDRAFVVVVDEDGAVRRSHEEPTRDTPPLAGWTLDSDAALDAAKEANAGIARGVEADRYGTLAFLTMEDDAPVWLVLAGGRDDGAAGIGFAKLSAADGAVLASWGGFGPR